MAMEPKPPQGHKLPIWIGGSAPAALERIGKLGDGWLGSAGMSNDQMVDLSNQIKSHAKAAGRNPDEIGMQAMLANPGPDTDFYKDTSRVVARAVELSEMGFGWGTINATGLYQAGARSVEAMAIELGKIHDAIRKALD